MAQGCRLSPTFFYTLAKCQRNQIETNLGPAYVLS